MLTIYFVNGIFVLTCPPKIDSENTNHFDNPSGLLPPSVHV
jgi:hypothetical protein